MDLNSDICFSVVNFFYIKRIYTGDFYKLNP